MEGRRKAEREEGREGGRFRKSEVKHPSLVGVTGQGNPHGLRSARALNWMRTHVHKHTKPWQTDSHLQTQANKNTDMNMDATRTENNER